MNNQSVIARAVSCKEDQRNVLVRGIEKSAVEGFSHGGGGGLLINKQVGVGVWEGVCKEAPKGFGVVGGT
jgi:hypothetical protein